jgi:hypothetical protein
VDALKSLLGFMHGDPSVVTPEGILTVLPEMEHLACFPELCVLQKYSRANLDTSMYAAGCLLPDMRPCATPKVEDWEERKWSTSAVVNASA